METTLDGLQPIDAERIFAGSQLLSLTEIQERVGQKVMQVWSETCYKKARYEDIPMRDYPHYLELYMLRRYDLYANPGK